MSHMPTSSQPASFSSSPTVTLTNASGGTVVSCTPVYNSSADSFSNAKGDTLAHATCVGLAQSDITNGASGLIQTDGSFTATTAQWDAIAGTSGGLTFATWYYVHPTTAARLTATPPSVGGQFSTRVGLGMSSTVLLIFRQPPVGL